MPPGTVVFNGHPNILTFMYHLQHQLQQQLNDQLQQAGFTLELQQEQLQLRQQLIALLLLLLLWRMYRLQHHPKDHGELTGGKLGNQFSI